MSHRATSWAWTLARRLNAAGDDRLEPGALLVLLAMADVADEYDIAYPSRQTVASWTGQSEKTVRRHVLILEARDLILRLTERRRRETGVFAQDAWTLNVDGDGEPPDPDEVDRRIEDKAHARRQKQAKGSTTPAVKMTGGRRSTPAVKKGVTSGQNGHASIEYPVSDPVREGAHGRAPAGAGAPSDGSFASRWEQFLGGQQAENPGQARSWFEPVKVEGEGLVAPTRFHVDYLRTHLGHILRRNGIDLDEVPVSVAPVIRAKGSARAK